MQAARQPADTVTLGAGLMAVAGLGMMGYALLFVVVNFTQLIEIGLSPAHVGRTPEEIWAFGPGVYQYISHLQVNLGAFIAATGLAIALMSWFGVRARQRWAWWSVVSVAMVWGLGALPIHHVYGFDTLLHVGPGYLTLVVLAVGAYLARPGAARYA